MSSRTTSVYNALQFKNMSTPTTPSADYAKLYVKSDVLRYLKSTGTEVSLDPTSASYIYGDDKSAAATTFGFTSDSGATGLFKGTTGYLGFSVGGTERARIDAYTGMNVAGDLTVQGTLTTIDSTTVQIADNMFITNSGQAYTDGGIAVKRSAADITGDTASVTGTAQSSTAPDSGTAQGGSASTIILKAGTVGGDDYNVGYYVTITGGPGANQTKKISGYVASTQTATIVGTFSPVPTSSSTYSIAATIVLAADTPGADDEYAGWFIKITGGTSSGDIRQISHYTATGNIASIVGSWTGVPDGTSTYSLFNKVYSALTYSASDKQMKYLYITDQSTSTFTGTYIDARMGKLQVDSGSVSATSIAFSGDAGKNTGLYYTDPGAVKTLNVAANGTQVMTAISTAINSLVDLTVATNKFSVASSTGNTLIAGTLGITGVTSLAAGAVGAPGVYFSTNSTSGLYEIATNNIGVSISGSKILDIASTGLSVVGLVNLSNGASTAPSLTFTSDSGLGAYRVGLHQLGIVANAKKALMIEPYKVTHYQSDNEYVGYQDVVDQASVAGDGATHRMVDITIPNSGICKITVDSVAVLSTDTSVVDVIKGTYIVVATAGGVVTSTPLIEELIDTAWTFSTEANLLKLNLAAHATDAKYSNVRVIVQPMNNTGCTAAPYRA